MAQTRLSARELRDGGITTVDLANLAVTDAKVATANKDGAAATPSMRTLGTGALQAVAGNDSRLSNTRAPSAHTHGNISNIGAIGVTAGLPIITGVSGVLQVGSFGITAGTFAQGNDARLSDARPATDVYAWAKAAVKPTYNKTEVGLSLVDNTADASKSVSYANTAGSVTNATNSSTVGFSTNNALTNTVPLFWGQIIGPTSGNIGLSITDALKVQPSTGSILANKFVVNGGDSSQYLMGDGSLSTGAGADPFSGSILNTTGYQKFSNGLIMQWGWAQTNSNHNTRINYPITFPVTCTTVFITMSNRIAGTSTSSPYIDMTGVKYTTNTGFYGGSSSTGGGWSWLALGY